MSNITADTALREAANFFQTGQRDRAFEAAQRALRARPGDAQALLLMGVISLQRGKPVEAEAYLRQGMVTQPDNADLWCNLGMTYISRQDAEKALNCFQEGLRRNKVHVDCWYNAGGVFLNSGRLEEALAYMYNAAQNAPARWDVHMEFGRLLMISGRVAEGAQAFARAGQIQPANAVARMNVLHALQYLDGVEADKIASDHRRFGEAFAKSMPELAADFKNTRDAGRALTVGLVCHDMRNPSIAPFVAPLLRHMPAEKMVFHCFTNGDPTGSELRDLCKNWTLIPNVTTADLVQHIRGQGIDVLIDMTGYSGGSRLDIFAVGSAPVQMAWLGYPGTTGIPRIDARIVDGVIAPAGSESESSESLARMDGCMMCFEPRGELKARGPIARRAGDVFTFGAFTGLPRISAACIRVWSRILREAAGSRLLIRSQFISDAGTWARVAAAFDAEGAPANSVQPVTVADQAGLYMALESVDVMLDSMPFSGAASVCEHLWLGLPVLSCAGASEASRGGSSVLRAAGLGEFAATSEEELVAKAVGLAKDPSKLRDVRAGLRKKIETSALMDGPRFAAGFEKVVRDAWRTWCAGKA
jgi:predicted O-linked N-acetylglucosamine transferase (SPINDLY family)